MSLDLEAITVTFSGGLVSTIGNLGVKSLVGIVLPSNWSGAHAITFQVSPINDGVNFYPLTDENGTAVTISATAASTFYAISNYAQWAAVNVVSLVTVTTNQTCNAKHLSV